MSELIGTIICHYNEIKQNETDKRKYFPQTYSQKRNE